MAVQNQDFPQPPRVTGVPATDLASLVEYLWSFYRSAILGGGLIQNTQLSSQLQTQFARLYNLAVLAGGAADKLPYLTDEDDWAFADLPSAGRDLISKTSIGAMLAYLGITIYTNELVQDVVATLIQNGTGIAWTYNDGANTLTGDVSITQYTDEMARDAVAALIQNGTGITWVYDDGANTLTPTVTITQYTDELARDAIAAFIQNGFGINWTHDDPGNTLTPDITMPTYTVGTVPDAATNVRRWIYVSDEVGGAVPAFSDGAAWRRCTDRAVVS